MANIIIAQLLFLQMADPKKDIHLYINSPGGSVTAGLAIYDTIQYHDLRREHLLRRAGGEHGRGAVGAGTKGKRFALPNSNIMIHQVLGGAEGQASDVEIRVKYMLKLKKTLNGILPSTRASRLNRWNAIATATISCPPRKRRLTACGSSRAIAPEIPGDMEKTSGDCSKQISQYT